MLVGAEAERKALEKLLTKKIRLTGVGEDDSEKCELVGQLKYGSIGFGGKYAEEYGLGKKYDMDEEFTRVNERFTESVSLDAIPTVLKKKGTTKWVQSSTKESTDMTGKVDRMSAKRRTKLSYLGLSL